MRRAGKLVLRDRYSLARGQKVPLVVELRSELINQIRRARPHGMRFSVRATIAHGYPASGVITVTAA
jgi:hypothetical protein